MGGEKLVKPHPLNIKKKTNETEQENSMNITESWKMGH